MKLLLLFVFVNGVFSYFNFPNFNPDYNFLSGCTRQYVFDGQGNFSNFIPLGSLRNNKPRKGTKEIVNTVICYKGDPLFELAVTQLRKNPTKGDQFIAADLDGWDHTKSKLYYNDYSDSCTTVYTPQYFSFSYTNCISLELEDYYSGGKGRVSVSVLGKFPITLTCFDVPGGLISGLGFLSLTTLDEQQKGGTFWYDCDATTIRPGVWGRKSGVYINVSQGQKARFN